MQGIGGSERWDDPNVLAVGNATDGALSECGFTGCASRLSTGFEWEQKVRFMLNLQAGGKAYMDNSYWVGGENCVSAQFFLLLLMLLSRQARGKHGRKLKKNTV
jgi:hypothetical protein